MNRFPLLLLIFFSLSTFSQTNRSLHAGGTPFQVVQYDTNIFRVSYLPPTAWHNELISDAVILRAAKSEVGTPATHFENGISISHLNTEVSLSVYDSAGYQGFHILMKTGERIYGGGERALPLNRRGFRLALYNNPWYGYGLGADNLNYSVPFVTSTGGYGLFFDNPSKSYLDLGFKNKDSIEYAATSGEINCYVIFGSPQQILSSYHKLTGKQPLPPRWVFGNLMSRFGYTSEAQVKSILQQMQQDSIPVDAVIFDLFWFGNTIKGTLGNLEWVDKTKWPDPKKMIGGFRRSGINTVLVTEPFVLETSKNYKASKNFLAVDSAGRPYYLTDFYFGRGGLIDIFRPDARDWFWKFYKKQMELGVEAWWGDLGEPENHPVNLYHNLKAIGAKRLFRSTEVHNLYGHTWTKMLFEKYAKHYPNKRLFSLNRSGFAGSQRYGIFPWTGDVSRSWSGLQAQLPILLGMSMSGVPYVHSDAGGFAGGEGDNELYVRWLQFAAFTPVFRPHGTALYEIDTAAFSFPSEAALIGEPYKAMAKQVIDLRYRMLPYNYTLAYKQATIGQPLISPLAYTWPDDQIAVEAEDEFMWGRNILVAPVLNKSFTTRRYYLPKGRWYKQFTGQSIAGGKWFTDSADLTTTPYFIRAGSFMPLNETRTSSISDSLTIMYFPSTERSTSEVYHDDGKSKNALSGNNFQLLRFNTSGLKSNQLEFIFSSTGKLSADRISKLRLVIPGLPFQPSKVIIGDQEAVFTSSQDHKGAYVLTVPSIKVLKPTILVKIQE